MDKRSIICIVCPLGCQLEISDDGSGTGYIVKGNKCKRGEAYGIKEMTSPTRVLTATVRLKASRLKRLPVRTDGAIPKSLLRDCMKVLKDIEVEPPVKMGEVIIENILDTGVNVISSRSI